MVYFKNKIYFIILILHFILIDFTNYISLLKFLYFLLLKFKTKINLNLIYVFTIILFIKQKGHYEKLTTY